jgi:hypothetical protein
MLGLDPESTHEYCSCRRWDGCVRGVLDGALRGRRGIEGSARPSGDRSDRVTDAFNFIGNYIGEFYGPSRNQDDHSTQVSFRSVIPFKAFGQSNILRLTVPYRVDGRGGKGIGDVSLFDLVVVNETAVRPQRPRRASKVERAVHVHCAGTRNVATASQPYAQRDN